MRKHIIIILLMFLYVLTYSQTTNYLNSSKIHVEYIDIEVTFVKSNSFHYYEIFIIEINRQTNLPTNVTYIQELSRELNLEVLTLYRKTSYYKLHVIGWYESKSSNINYLL